MAGWLLASTKPTAVLICQRSPSRQPHVCLLLPYACRDYEAQVADGRLVAGQHETYHGNQPLAYGCDPAENVIFNGCHDNETIFDQVRL